MILFDIGSVLWYTVKGMDEREAKSFYNSKAWKKKRMEILKRDYFECQDCRARLRKAQEQGVTLTGTERFIRRAEEVHHKLELREHPELALDDDNLISLCVQCHNMRHGRCQYRFVKCKKPVTEERW